jgi:Uma2 family endonuclease
MATRFKRFGWTYAEYARLPDDGNRYEVIGGELHVTPAPRPIHQEVLIALTVLLRDFAERHRLGWVLPAPIDVLFAEGEYVQPDIVFVRRERRGIITDRGIEGPPDLIVEVTSDSTARKDRGDRLRQYTRFAVPHYWIADPEARHVEVHGLLEGATEPTIHVETVSWTPVPGSPTLTVEVPPLLRGFE